MVTASNCTAGRRRGKRSVRLSLSASKAPIERSHAQRFAEHVGPAVAMLAVLRSKLVGRRWEMSRLRGLVGPAHFGGHGAVVEVVGEPGIGKSRLVREVAAMAAVRGRGSLQRLSVSPHTLPGPHFHAVGASAAGGRRRRGLLTGQAAPRPRVRDQFSRRRTLRTRCCSMTLLGHRRTEHCPYRRLIPMRRRAAVWPRW